MSEVCSGEQTFAQLRTGVRAVFIHVCQQSTAYTDNVHVSQPRTPGTRHHSHQQVCSLHFIFHRLTLACRSVAWHQKVTCIVASHHKSGFSNLSRVWISLATGPPLQLSVPVPTGQTTCTELHWLCSARFRSGAKRPNNLHWAPLTLLCASVRAGTNRPNNLHRAPLTLLCASVRAGTNRPNNLHWAPLTLLCPFPCRCEQGKYLHWAGQCLARANRPNNLQCPACQLPWRSCFVLRSAGRLKPQI